MKIKLPKIFYMKNIYVLFFFLICGFANAQIVNIPDVNFKNALLAHSPTIDVNLDGEIQVSEALATDTLNIYGWSISSLEGIENFINLKFLDCSVNNITNIDL